MPAPTVSSRGGLRQRAFAAGRWSVFGLATSQAIRLVTTLVMTRLLTPDMFGVMAIVVMVYVVAGLLTDLGIRQNIVQRQRDDDRAFLDTAWTMQIVRGAVIWALAALVAAGLYAAGRLGGLSGDTVYASPILPALLLVSTLTVVISGFQSTKVALAERDLQQRPLIRIELSSQLSAFVVMVVVAWLTGSIWSLVLGQLAAATIATALSHVALAGPRNRLAWDPVSLRELLDFGKWIFASSFAGVLALNADRIVLGGLVSAEVLGQFAIAATLVAAVQGVFSKLYATLVMPILSETAREDRARLKEVFYRVRIPTDLALLFAAGLLGATGQLVVDLLYDHRYADAGWMLQILAISLVWARYEATQQLYLALGLPRYVAFLNFARLVSVFAAMLLGFSLAGVHGAIWGFALHQAVVALLTYRFNATLGLNDFLRDFGVLVALPAGYGVGLAIERFAGR